MPRLTPIALALSLISFQQIALAQSSDTNEKTQTLETVDVKAAAESSWDTPPVYAGGQVAQGARLGVMGNENVMDVPFSMISYTDKLIEDQQAQTLSQVLANDPSIRNLTTSGHMIENFKLRGFDYYSNDMAINGLFGLAPRGTTPTEMFERVEVLKGPSTLFSAMPPNGAIGGVINLVPKRAGDDPINQVTVGYASNSQVNTAIDVGRRFGEDNAWGIRVNGAYSEGGTTIDNQTMRRDVASVALDYRGTQLKASLDSYYTNIASNGGLAPGGVSFASTTPGTVLPAFNPHTNMQPNASGQELSSGYIGRAEYAFNETFTGFASLGYATTSQYGYIQGNHIYNLAANGSASLLPNFGVAYTNTLSSELGGRAHFSTGEIGHELVVQATDLQWTNGTATNYYCKSTGLSSSTCSGAANYQSTSIYNPSNLNYPSMPGYIPKTNSNTLSSVALIDTLSFLDETVLLTVGARQQRVQTNNFGTSGATNGVITSSYDKSRLSPTAGLVVKPWGPSISLYANYAQGLSAGSSVTDSTATNYGQAFAPFVTTQEEVGVKWNAGSITNTLAMFSLEQPAVTVSGPATIPTYSDTANKRVQGIEWETYGELVHNVRVLGGVTYMRGTLSQYSVKSGSAITSYNGNTAYGVPQWQANLGTEWDIPWVLPGLTLTDRVNATSNQYINSSNTQQIPGWATLDLGVRYATGIGGHKTTFRVNVNNVFNQYYWGGAFADGYALLGSPRTVLGSVTVDF